MLDYIIFIFSLKLLLLFFNDEYLKIKIIKNNDFLNAILIGFILLIASYLGLKNTFYNVINDFKGVLIWKKENIK